MPGMLLFGRRWMIGSDDLFLPFLIAVSIRVTWLVAVCSIIGVHHQLTHSHSFLNAGHSCGFKMDIYLLGYIIILTGTSFFDSLIVYISSRGTIFREEKRRAMPGMIYGRLGIYFLELLWLAVGVYLLITERKQCINTTDHVISKGLIICNMLLFLCVLVFTYLSFDTAGRLWYKKETLSRSRNSSYGSIYFNDMIKNRYEENWKRSCKTLFCCFKIESANENVFGFIARQFAESFHDQVNLVPSDILAGLILLRKYQQVLEARQIQQELESKGTNSSGVDLNSGKEEKTGKQNFKAVFKHQRTLNWKPFDMGNEEHFTVLEKAVYFVSHTMAVYGWPGYLYRQTLCSPGCCKLCCGVKCCCFGCPLRRILDIPSVGDNCFECNIAATNLALALEDVELVHVSYHDEVFEPPFFVAVDHNMKAVVVSCRGTMSLKDVLTDLIIEEERIPLEDGDPAWKAHSGMLHSARYVLDHLMSEDLLNKAFGWDLTRRTDTYQLTLVGHSLGAGVAAILAFLLRPKFPNLLCFGYSPPGITFNKAAAKYSEDFVYSVIVGKDVIPRLNLYTFHEMKFKLLRLIQETELPKWRIIRGCLCQCMLCCTKLNRVPHDAYLDIELPDLPPFGSDVYPVSYVAGKIIHFVKTKSLYPRYIGKKRAEYEAVWASSEDFQSVLISTLMWKDHLPDTVFNTLQTYWKEQLAPFGVSPREGLQDWRLNKSDDSDGTESGSAISPLVEDSTESHTCMPIARDNAVHDVQGTCIDHSTTKQDLSDVHLTIDAPESEEAADLSGPTLPLLRDTAMDSSRMPNENVVT